MDTDKKFNVWQIEDLNTENSGISDLNSNLIVSDDDMARSFWKNYTKSIHDLMDTYVKYISEIKIGVEDSFYRARAMKDIGQPYRSVHEMKAPPANFAGAGRINPAGMSFLYTAVDIETIRREVHQENEGTPLTVVKCSPNKTLRVLDLTIDQQEKEKVNSFRRVINDNFSKPVDLKNAVVEYLPTQLIAVYIKDVMGLDGVKYKSSVYPLGYNVVIFDDSNVDFWILNEVAYSTNIPQ